MDQPSLSALSPDLAGLGIFLIVLGIVGIFLYFVPAYVAYKRKHPNALGIFVVNLCFGWLLVGWVAALVWALWRKDTPAAPVVVYQMPPGYLPAEIAHTPHVNVGLVQSAAGPIGRTEPTFYTSDGRKTDQGF